MDDDAAIVEQGPAGCGSPSVDSGRVLFSCFSSSARISFDVLACRSKSAVQITKKSVRGVSSRMSNTAMLVAWCSSSLLRIRCASWCFSRGAS